MKLPSGRNCFWLCVVCGGGSRLAKPNYILYTGIRKWVVPEPNCSRMGGEPWRVQPNQTKAVYDSKLSGYTKLYSTGCVAVSFLQTFKTVAGFYGKPPTKPNCTGVTSTLLKWQCRPGGKWLGQARLHPHHGGHHQMRGQGPLQSHGGA